MRLIERSNNIKYLKNLLDEGDCQKAEKELQKVVHYKWRSSRSADNVALGEDLIATLTQ
jgi:hypothetical protein